MTLDQGLDAAVDHLDLCVEAGDDGLDRGFDGIDAGSREAVFEGLALGDQILAGQHHDLEAIAMSVGLLPAGELAVSFPAVTGERLGVEGVGLAQGPKRTDEVFDLMGIGSMGGAARGERGRQKGAS